MPLLFPASVQAHGLRDVWLIFLGAAALVAVVVYSLVLFAVFRWRARAGAEGRIPPQFANNAPLEITGVVIPLLMVIGLFVVTYIRESAVDAVEPAPYAIVDVRAFQWSWEFSYPGHGITVAGTPRKPPVLVLPEGKLTQINLYSDDVNHAFWVPAFLFKRDAIPGLTNRFDITPDKLGSFSGVCAEYCGLDHALMQFTVRVVPAADYDRWIASGGSAAP